MSCLTSGYSVSCSTSCAGGLDKFYLATIDDIASVTVTAGEVTAITMDALTYFWEFKPYQETGSFTETGERTNCNTVVSQTLSASFPCHNQALRDAIEEMQDCCCGLVVIHQENNGNRWIWGLTEDLHGLTKITFPAQISGFETVTGQAINDQNQTTITITARGTMQALPVDGAVVVPVAP
jgi:hypothetical protein